MRRCRRARWRDRDRWRSTTGITASNRATGFAHTDTLEKTIRIYQEQIQDREHEVRVCEDLLARWANGTGDALTGLGVAA